MTSRKSSGSIPVESAVDPTRSQNITVSWRRSASGAAATAAGAGDRQVALGRKGGRLLGVPQGRQWLRQRHGLGSGRAPLGRPDEKLAVDIGRDPLDDRSARDGRSSRASSSRPKAELDPAIGDAALLCVATDATAGRSRRQGDRRGDRCKCREAGRCRSRRGPRRQRQALVRPRRPPGA